MNDIAVKTQKDADRLIKIMRKHGIEARVAGKVVETSEGQEPNIKIINIK